MKKTLSIILASMLTVSALPLTSSALELNNIRIEYDDINARVLRDADSDGIYETELKRGDVNGNSIIDASDASAILQIYSEISVAGNTDNIDEATMILADYNNDGFIDSNDASYVLSIYANNSVKGTENSVSVTTETLNEGITIDGVEIQSGATAVTVNVANNKGFSLFDFVLDVGSGYDVITDTDGRPVFSKCRTVNYLSNIESSVNDDTIVINGLFAYDCLTEGGIITFYANENSDSNKSVSLKSSKLYSSEKWREYGSGTAYHEAGCPLILNGELIERNPIENNSVYMVGDINGDMKIDLTDAFDAFYTAYISTNSGFSQMQDIVWKMYFPNITDIRAAFLWNEYSDSSSEIDNMGRYTTTTADEILKYCADISAGKEHISDSYITEIRHVG